MGITITDVKIVGSCSKHGGKHKWKDGSPVRDEKIHCIECGFENDS